MPMGKGLVAHTLHEERELNDYSDLFDHLPSAKPHPDIIQLATQLIDRQTGRYDPSDVEDRYETRLRAVIDAKLKGEGIEPEDEEEPDRTNVVDLMSALRKSLDRSDEKPIPSKRRQLPSLRPQRPRRAGKPKLPLERSRHRRESRPLGAGLES
jgi:DNA end-binding protein Ku